MSTGPEIAREQNRKAKAARRARRRASGYRTITIEVRAETAERLASIRDGLALRHLGQAFDKVLAERPLDAAEEASDMTA